MTRPFSALPFHDLFYEFDNFSDILQGSNFALRSLKNRPLMKLETQLYVPERPGTEKVTPI